MVLRLNAADEDFERRFEALVSARRETAGDVDQTVRSIMADVRGQGDVALLAYTRRFDRHDLKSEALRIRQEEIDASVERAPPEILDALKLARDRIEAYHARQRPQDEMVTDGLGVVLGARWLALDAVGIYVPGGTASYPSSVLMNAVPAKVAGVARIVMVVPSPQGRLNPLVLAAARIAGVDEIYRIGGAQAIAALAYGTETIAPVVKIVGPGNAFVAAAKRQVFGHVGIDMIAGPSEVLVVADAENDPDWIAADLLAQSEHDTNAQAILITDSEKLAWSVEAAVERQLSALKRAETARSSWREFGAIVLVEDITHCAPLIDRIAPEHLELCVSDPETLLGMIHNAGAIFLGRHTPVAIGDYVAGCNHVLPTGRSARFSSGLSVLDFMKRTSLLRLDAESLGALAPAAAALAEAEGFGAHARSVAIRLNR
jgi:histidinol dehydrogenase